LTKTNLRQKIVGQLSRLRRKKVNCPEKKTSLLKKKDPNGELARLRRKKAY